MMASKFANTTMLNILKPFSNNLPVPLLDEMMEEAVKSDSMEAVAIVKDILSDHHHRVSQDTITTARSRGLVGIIKSLDPEFEDTSEQQKQALKQAVLDKTASIEGKKIEYFYVSLNEIILDLIPKSTEIEYNEKIPEVLRLIPTADQGKTVEVAFSKLLTLHKVFI